MAVPFAERMARLGTETAFDVLGKAKALEAQGRRIIHLEIGEPDFDTPKPVCDEAKKAIEEKNVRAKQALFDEKKLEEITEEALENLKKGGKISIGL